MMQMYQGLIKKVKFKDGSSLAIGDNAEGGLKVVSIEYMFPQAGENMPHCVEVGYSNSTAEVFYDFKSLVVKKAV